MGIFGLLIKRNEDKNLSNKTSNKSSIKTVPIPTVSETKTNDIFIFNELIKEIETPKKIEIIKKTKNQIDDNLINEILERFGFEETSVIKETNYEMYETKDFKKSINFDKQNNVIEYNTDLLLSPLKVNSIIFDDDWFKTKTEELIKDYFQLNDFDFTNYSINYLTINDNVFRFVDKSKANYIELKMNYMFNNYPVYFLDGFPLEVIFDGEGNLIKFRIVLPSKMGKTGLYSDIRKISELKKDQFEIVRTDAEYMIEIKDLENNFSIKKSYLALFDLKNLNELVPSLVLEGISEFEEEKNNIIIAAPILK